MFFPVLRESTPKGQCTQTHIGFLVDASRINHSQLLIFHATAIKRDLMISYEETCIWETLEEIKSQWVIQPIRVYPNSFGWNDPLVYTCLDTSGYAFS